MTWLKKEADLKWDNLVDGLAEYILSDKETPPRALIDLFISDLKEALGLEEE